MSLLDKIKPDQILNEDDLFQKHKEFTEDRKVRWIFRGQKNEAGKTRLKTSLEKAIKSFKIEIYLYAKESKKATEP